MCRDTRIPRDACAGHIIPRETRIPATPAKYIHAQPTLLELDFTLSSRAALKLCAHLHCYSKGPTRI